MEREHLSTDLRDCLKYLLCKGETAVDIKVRKRIENLALLDTADELDKPHIELCSDKIATIEGCKGIIEYNENTVRVNCGKLIVKCCGDALSINAPNSDTITVSGTIISVEYST